MSEPSGIRSVVVGAITDLLQEEGKDVPELTDGIVLMESGLDSLGFAVLVTRLEDTLGYDPFTEMAQPVYPTTLGDFVQIYAAHVPQH